MPVGQVRRTLADVLELVHPEDLAAYERVIDERLETGRSISAQVRFRHSSGIYLPVRSSAQLMDTTPGSRILVGSVLDLRPELTARREADEGRAIFEIVQKTVPGTLYIYDLIEGRNIFLSRSPDPATGVDADDLLGTEAQVSLETIIHPDDFPKLQAHWRALDEGRDDNVSEVELRVLAGQDEYVWMVARDAPLRRDPDGRLRQLVGFSHEIQERRQMEQQLRGALNAIETCGIPVIQVARDGAIAYVNPAARRAGDLDEDQLVGRNVREFLTSEVVEQLDTYWESLPFEEPQALSLRLAIGDGQAREVVANLCRVATEPSETLWVFIDDQTRRLETERGLRRATSVLGEAERLSRFGAWDWDMVTGETWWSAGLYRLYDREPERGPPGEDWLEETIHPDDREGLVAAIQAARQSGVYRAEFRLRRPHGTVRWLSARGEVIFDGDEPRRLVGVAMDVTEQRLSQEATQASERRFRAIFHGAPYGMMLVTDGDRVDLVNETMLGMSGYQSEELVGRRIDDLLPEDPEALAEKTAAVRRGESVSVGRSEEIHVHRKDGTHFLAEVALAPVAGADSFLAIVIDQTERIRLETQMRQSGKLEAVGQLAGAVAHDFNNIIMAIQLSAEEVLERVPDDEVAADSLHEITNDARRAAELTRQLLAFSRKQILAPQRLELRDVVGGMSRMLTRLIGSTLDIRPADELEPCVVNADRGQLEQVLLNLVVNARDAAGRSGRIRVETERRVVAEPIFTLEGEVPPGDYAMLRVSDNGAGIPDDVLPHLFEPFFTTKSRGDGTGLGLATVHGIVSQSQGFITVDTEIGRGTAFEVYLPICEAPTTETASSDERRQAVGRGERIVLVEDERGVRNAARRALERAGYVVEIFETAERALAALREGRVVPELLISDVVLPGMTGDELAATVREIQPGLPVIFMSGYDQGRLRGVLAEEATAFLQKPVSGRMLARRAGEMLRPGGGSGERP